MIIFFFFHPCTVEKRQNSTEALVNSDGMTRRPYVRPDRVAWREERKSTHEKCFELKSDRLSGTLGNSSVVDLDLFVVLKLIRA